MQNKFLLALTLIFISGCASTTRIEQARHPMTPADSFSKRGRFKLFYYYPSTVQHSANAGREPTTSEQFRYIPFRTVAIDPQRVLPGSVVFIPQAYGFLLPTGEIHDGFFLAQDVRPEFRKNMMGLFLPDAKAKALMRQAQLPPGTEVEVYQVAEPYESAVLNRFAEQYTVTPAKPLYRMVAKEIDQLIRETNKAVADIHRRIAIYSERAKGTPYLIFLLGEGPGAPYDQDPLMDFARVDCMTFCEQILAMAISDDYSQMFQRLQRIRYKDGLIDFKWRNHYTIADWLPNNAWLLRDVTAEIGGEFTRKMTKVIDRRRFFLSNGLSPEKLFDVAPPETLTVDYIPEEHLLDIKDRLKGGEVVSIVTTYPGIVSAHMGFIIRDKYGNVVFRHGSSQKRKMKVVDELLEDVVAALKRSRSRVGMIFMRVRDDWEFPKKYSDNE